MRNNPDLEVVALAAGNNVELMEKQIREFHPSVVSMQTETAAKDLSQRISDLSGVRVCYGMDGLLEVAVIPDSQVLVTGIVGMIGN